MTPIRHAQRLQPLLLPSVATLLAAFVGVGLVRHGAIMLTVVALVAASLLIVALVLQPRGLFALWLAVAPFVQTSIAETRTGHLVRIAAYSVPPLLFLMWALVRRRAAAPGFVDAVPLLYCVLVAVSAALGQDHVTFTQVYSIVGIGVALYYFCAFASFDGTDVAALAAAILLATASVVSILIVFDKLTGIGIAAAGFQTDVTASAERAAGTLANPAVFGTYAGAALTLGVAILAWRGPQRLRRLSWLTVFVTPIAIALTLTRTPLIAAGAVGLLALVMRSRTRWLAVLGVAFALTLVAASWSSIGSTHLYQTRFSNTLNVDVRLVMDRWSFKLAGERPVLGWGYGSFDRVKNASNFSAAPLSRQDVLLYTSHNTFLTILVETGMVGLILLLASWLVIVKRAIGCAVRTTERRWAVVGFLAVLGVWIVNAGSIDMRFFSLASALPWLALGLLRRETLDLTAGP